MQHERPRVSVVIPVYNSMPYLLSTLGSLADQDLGDGELEVIAVDDGSTDGSGDALDAFAAKDPRFHVIHQPNSGWPGMPRNRGMDRAQGDFVFFMDADDTMAPEALRTMIEDADAQSTDVVIPRMQGTGGRGVQGVFTKHPHGQISVSKALETLSPQKLFRTDFLRENDIRFPEGKVRLEDGMFVAKAYVLARRIDILTRTPLYFIHQRDDGQNISSRPIDAAGYDNSVRVISEIVRAGTPDPAEADRLTLELFTRKGLRWYAPKRWIRMRPARQQEWFDLHHQFMLDMIPVGLEDSVAKVEDQRKLRLLRAGDLQGMRQLIQDGVNLEHQSLVRDVALRGAQLELVVRFTLPQVAVDASSLTHSARMKIAFAAGRLLAPLQRWDMPGKVVRRLERVVGGARPSVRLELGGRGSSKTASLQPRPGLWDAGEGTVEARFLVPHKVLRRFSGQIVDCWSVLCTPSGAPGPRFRVQAPSSLAGAAKAPVRPYATVQGNFSIDLRGLK